MGWNQWDLDVPETLAQAKPHEKAAATRLFHHIVRDQEQRSYESAWSRYGMQLGRICDEVVALPAESHGEEYRWLRHFVRLAVKVHEDRHFELADKYVDLACSLWYAAHLRGSMFADLMKRHAHDAFTQPAPGGVTEEWGYDGCLWAAYNEIHEVEKSEREEDRKAYSEFRRCYRILGPKLTGKVIDESFAPERTSEIELQRLAAAGGVRWDCWGERV